MDAIILMTRVPHPGGTKTRLMPTMTGIDCAELHTSFLLDCFNCLDKVKNQADLFVSYAPENATHEFFEIIPKNFGNYVQEGTNIGERMYNAFDYLFKKGYSSVILVGSDIPSIQPRVFRDAITSLKENDIVISQTYDGGYCLIGINKNYKELFINDVRWGNQSVINNTFRIANDLGLTIGLLEKLRDIDLPEDLIEFIKWSEDIDSKKENAPFNTIKCLKEILKKNGYRNERYSG